MLPRPSARSAWPAYGMALLRHAEPAIRAQACRCVPPHPSVVAILVDLLGDLHPTVATAAACALGHFGHREARPILGQLLREEPTADVISAVVAIADADGGFAVVWLIFTPSSLRWARNHPFLNSAVLSHRR